jgi:hypothetical protein
MSNTFTAVQHPLDPKYRLDRRRLINELLQMDEKTLDLQLQYQMRQKPPLDNQFELTKRIVGEIYNSSFVPDNIKSILDTTGATTGNVLIRQDLEAPMYALDNRAIAA